MTTHSRNKLLSNRYVVIGKIGAAHGLRGWVKVYAYTQPQKSILDYQPWLVGQPDCWQPIDVAQFSLQQKFLLVQFTNVTDRDTAQQYTNQLIATPRSQLPAIPQDEYYWSDLEGLTVYTVDQVLLGTIDYLIATGSNDVLVIKGKKKRLIPYLPNEVVVSINLQQQIMIVNWDPEF